MNIKIDLKIFALIFFLIVGGQSNAYLILFVFTIIHELGHLFCGIIFGLKLESIKLMPVGVSISFKKKEISYKKKLCICIAGPLVNLMIASGLILINTNNQDFIYSNILIGIFNMIPIIPLDGGRMLRILLRRFYLIEKADRYCMKISNGIMIILTVLTIIAAICLKNFFLLITIIYLWAITIMENKKIRIERTIIPYLNTKSKVDKSKI